MKKKVLSFEQKRLRKNICIIALIVVILATAFFWVGVLAYLEINDLILNGTEVTATIDSVIEQTTIVDGGGGMPNTVVVGYKLSYKYVDESGRVFSGLTFGRFQNRKMLLNTLVEMFRF